MTQQQTFRGKTNSLMYFEWYIRLVIAISK